MSRPNIVTYLDPAPVAGELPTVFASPFATAPPHPLAARAAAELLAGLRDGRLGVDAAALDAPGAGKMFGVLVVVDPAGRVGYLRAFSGMLADRWDLDGFVPPLFDPARRDAMWPQGQAALRVHELALRALDDDPATVAARAALAAHDAATADAVDAERVRHRDNRLVRRAARAAGDDPVALDQQSRADAAARRRGIAARAAAREPLAGRVDAIEAQRTALERQRADESRALMKELHDHYELVNARGERRALRALFAPGEPPAGAGDCAGPKLLGAAFRLGLRPVALAEVWWGAPPAAGGRHRGVFYPSCRGKCGPVLPHMLAGLPVDDAPTYGADAIAADQPRVVFEDAWLVIVDKPAGLLSVPGRSGALRDSVQTRLRRRYPQASGPLVVHRLDLDTSGLILAAKDSDTHAALQAGFARREIEKGYVAWLDGEVAAEGGTVELALRVDLDDRPRQLYDPVHGRPAVTTWRVVARAEGRTRVALVPHTGRTHQLRVHAAHPLGIGVPIVGDRLYGRAGPQLLLHAERLAFVHPRTGARVEVAAPCSW